MLFNLLKTGFRNLKRQPFFTFLNVSGLAVGMSASLLIGLYIYDELTYDHFHEKLDRIVRVNQTFIWGETDNLFSSVGPALRDVLIDEVPEFETVVRIHDPDAFLVSYLPENGSPRVFDEANILAADSNFLAVFTFPLISGNPATCLTEPNSALVTQETAYKYFGEESALGKMLLFGEGENQKSVKVTGVLKGIPSNSHIDFDFMLSMNSFPRVDRDKRSWIWTTFVTFGLLHENATIESARENIPRILETRLSKFLQAYRGMTYREYKESGKEWSLYFQPFSDVHLRSENIWCRLNETGSMEDIYVFATVAFLIMVISIINFINLATARATTRAREVGIRKVIGSGKGYLVAQFLAESVILTVVAAILAVFVAGVALPYFNDLSGKSISLGILESPLTLAVVLVAGVLIGFFAGIYPSFYLTSFRPINVLKGKLGVGIKSSGIRNSLVIVQFTISIILISCSLIVFDQMAYTRSYDLGFDRSNKILIKNVNRLGDESLKTFEEELRKLGLVEEVTLSVDAPPYIHDGDNFFLDGGEKDKVPLNFNLVDEKFVTIYDIPLIAGRNFRADGTESNKIIINETAMKSFGFQEPNEILGVNINYHQTPLKVVGVMADFSFSFEEVMPFALIPMTSDVKTIAHRTISVQLEKNSSPDEIAALIGSMEITWTEFNERIPFEYTFIDQEYAASFEPVLKFGKLLGTFSTLAVFIACIGLIGLVAFVIEKRNKEIGIRKVLGASDINIWLLLSGEFGRALAIGFALAIPVTWFFMREWLSDFEVHTTISITVFAFSGIIMTVLALITLSFQMIKAISLNPVDCLKEE